MMAYRDVKQKFGPAIANQIMTDKRAQEQSKRANDQTVYFMEHPDAKGVEESHLH